jgi:hypothetical protein
VVRSTEAACAFLKSPRPLWFLGHGRCQLQPGPRHLEKQLGR